MTREEVAAELVRRIEKVGQKKSEVSYTSFQADKDRGVTVIFIPTEQWDRAKWALEETFGRLQEEPKLQ